MVTATPGFEVVGEAESGEEAVELAEALTPGLVLMDINLPGINGIEATRRITAAHPDAVVMLLSTYQADDLPRDADSSGAVAYVHKEQFGPAVVRDLWAAHRPSPDRSPAGNGSRRCSVISGMRPLIGGARARAPTRPRCCRRWRRPGRSCSRSRGHGARRSRGRSRRRRRATSKSSAPSSSRTVIMAWAPSPACLAAFWSASRQQK